MSATFEHVIGRFQETFIKATALQEQVANVLAEAALGRYDSIPLSGETLGVFYGTRSRGKRWDSADMTHYEGDHAARQDYGQASPIASNPGWITVEKGQLSVVYAFPERFGGLTFGMDRLPSQQSLHINSGKIALQGEIEIPGHEELADAIAEGTEFDVWGIRLYQTNPPEPYLSTATLLQRESLAQRTN